MLLALRPCFLKINGMCATDRSSLSPAEGRVKKIIRDDRSRLWLPKIRAAMIQKPTFFAVGAAHLGCQHGLISLLKAEGYTLQPIVSRK
jgi:uncharacterized protein